MTAVLKADRLGELEGVIERGVATFVEVGNALMEIRDGKLYKLSHRTFEAYCKERWGWNRNYANKQIAAAKVTNLLGTTVPTSERVVRELAPLADEPETVVEVWERVTEEHGERPTAKQVREGVRRVVPRELSNAEMVRREVQTAIGRLRDWRARFGHLRPLREVVEFIDTWMEEQDGEQ